MSRFVKATKEQSRLRLCITGPAGAGKTMSALVLAGALGGRVAVIDTEHGSASKYAGEPGVPEFDVINLDSFAPRTFVECLRDAGAEGYTTVIIDSMSLAWMGKDGALEMVDAAAKRTGGNSFAAWKTVTPQVDALIEAIMASPCHVIFTLRAKMAYEQAKDERGRNTIQKLGMAPQFKDGVEYIADVVGDMDTENVMTISKTRCPALSGKTFLRPGADLANVLKAWLSSGVAPVSARPLQVPAAPPSNPPGISQAAIDFKRDLEAATTPEAVLALRPQVVELQTAKDPSFNECVLAYNARKAHVAASEVAQ